MPLRPWGWAGHTGAVPGRATGELGAQGTPAHPAVPPTPLRQSQLSFWAAGCQRGPFPPLCRCSGCRSPSRTPLLPRFPCVPRDEWVAAMEEGRRAGTSRSGEVCAALPGGDPPPARPQGPAKGQGHQTGAKPGVLGGQLPVTVAQDGAVTSEACVSLFPAQERAWERSQGSKGRGCPQTASGALGSFPGSLVHPKALPDPPHGPPAHPCRAETGWVGA